MFELSTPDPTAPVVAPPVLTLEGEPLEFGYRGRRFHIHAVISRWRESGGWWNRIDGGTEKSTSMTAAGGSEEFRILDFLDDGARTIWRVEAAPVGALATFEIELDEATGQWQIRPTSRPA